MFDSVSKAIFYKATESETLRQLASRYGLKAPGRFARRFVVGESVEEAIEAAPIHRSAGDTTTLDLLGQEVACAARQAHAAADAYLNAMAKERRAGFSRNFSMKLTQLGQGVERRTCLDRTRRCLDEARKDEGFVRIDMEDSAYTEATLEIFQSLWSEGYRNLRIVLQSYLYRTEADVRRMNRPGARVRLVKGAYNEPKEA